MASKSSLLSNSFFLLCDIQTRFKPIIHRMESVIHTASILTKSASILKIPLFVTEQNPTKLGETLPELKQLFQKNVTILEKNTFSMVPSLPKFPENSNFILFGIETHVCVTQTALDLLKNQHSVYIIADGVSSTRKLDRSVALRRLEREGCKLQSYEGMLMELIQSQNHPCFKDLLGLLKEKRPDGMLDEL